MPIIEAFRGYRYNIATVEINDVVAPPYDVISTELQDRLYQQHKQNIVRLILGREDDRYASAAKHFADWQLDGVLVRDEAPAIYVLHQTFDTPDGIRMTRKGFIALCKLEEFDSMIVLPHEKTLAKPREDRLKLIQATKANFSQVFSLYSDPELHIDKIINGVAKTEPIHEAMYEDVNNKLWRLTDPKIIAQIKEQMKDKQVLIADGHHRYETALAYRYAMRLESPTQTGQESYNYTMMFFTNIDHDALVVYPTHRLVHSLPAFNAAEFLHAITQFFIVREVKDHSALLEGLKSCSVCAYALFIQNDSKGYLITLKPSSALDEYIESTLPSELKTLDVTVLHEVILKGILGITTEEQERKVKIDYVKEPTEAVHAVTSGEAQLAFLMNATKIQQVRAVARAGYTMPQKSTYFYPKLLTGLVVNSLSEKRS